VDDERVVYSTYCTEEGNKEDETHEISKDSMDDRHMVLHRYVSKWDTAFFFLHWEFGTERHISPHTSSVTEVVQADSETSDQGVWGVYEGTLARRF